GCADATEAGDLVIRRPCAKSTGCDRSANQCRGFRTVYVFEHFRADAFAFGFNVRHLPADHSVYRARSGGNFRDHFDAAIGVGRSCRDSFESKGEQRVAGKDRGGFAKLFVASWLAPPEVLVIPTPKIALHKPPPLDKFDP